MSRKENFDINMISTQFYQESKGFRHPAQFTIRFFEVIYWGHGCSTAVDHQLTGRELKGRGFKSCQTAALFPLFYIPAVLHGGVD